MKRPFLNFSHVTPVGSWRPLTGFEEGFLRALDAAKVGALVARPSTPKGAAPHLVVTLKGFGVFRVVDFSGQHSPSRIFGLGGHLVAEASKPSELAERFYNKLLARMQDNLVQQAGVLGLKVTVVFTPLDESDR